MSFIDWFIVAILFVFIFLTAISVRNYNKSVADFLVANRSAGRYLVTMAEGMAGIGAISLIAYMEVGYKSGFVGDWWGIPGRPVYLLLALSGFIVYRYRQTRCLTLAQFFEKRYSKNFRIFSGIVCYVSGLINFGIFPGIGARFFVHFCGLPEKIHLIGINIPVFAIVMLLMILISLFFVFMGGQITILLTDFFQAIFCNFVFIAVALFFLFNLDWDTIGQVMLSQPPGESLVDHYDTNKIEGFNFYYFAIIWFMTAYNWQSWQGSQAYNASAKNAHEARMGKILSELRVMPLGLFVGFVPICAYVIMNGSAFPDISSSVQNAISSIDSEKLQVQMITPLVMREMLPVGMVGAVAAVMAAAFISTHDTYLHSWGSIFVQDVILPFRKEHLAPKQHVLLLRLSIVFVAIFIFLFSFFYNNTQHIMMFWQATSAIYTGGVGCVIIGGLYWKKGSAGAAWAAMITGSTLAFTGLILNMIYEDFFINGVWCYFISSIAAIVIYILISLLTNKKVNLDKLLHRGEYAVKEDCVEIGTSKGNTFLKYIGIGKEFSLGDKVIYFIIIAWGALWVMIFLIGNLVRIAFEITDSAWLIFWRCTVYLTVGISTISAIWLFLGGMIDVANLRKKLKSTERDYLDDGKN